MSAKVVRVPRAEQWATRITAQVGKSVEAILEIGRLLIAAKKGLPHGEWGRMFDEQLVPFSQRTADCLMAISRHSVLSNSQHIANLPPSWGTLYELTKVERPVLNRALREGLVTPEITRRAVTRLQAGKLPNSEPVEDVVGPPVAFARDDAIADRVSDVLQPVHRLIEQWPDTENLAILIHQLRQLLVYLERLDAQRHEVPTEHGRAAGHRGPQE